MNFSSVQICEEKYLPIFSNFFELIKVSNFKMCYFWEGLIVSLF